MKTPRAILLTSVILLLLAPRASVAADRPLSVSADRDSGVYAVGETVKWRVEWKGDAKDAPASVKCTVKKGGMAPVHEADVALTGGAGTIESRFDVAGWLLLEAKVGDQRALGGAVAAAEQVKPAVPRPDDFDAFWVSKLDELRSVPPAARLSPMEGLKEGVNYNHVTLDNIRGSKINGQLARPKQGDKLPALLIVQWAGVYPLETNWVTDRAAEGWLVLNILPHELPIDNPAEFYKQQAEGPLKNYPGIGNDDRETSYFLRMYLSCYQAAEYLTTRPDWDGKTLVVQGGSQGGMQALVTAALHPKVTAALASVPAGCDMRGPDAGRLPGWPMWYWNVGDRDPVRVRRAGEYFDVVNFAPRIKCPVLVGIGLIDETCPPEGILAAVNQVAAPKEVVLLPKGGHQNEDNSHGDYDKRCWGAWLPALRKGEPAPVAERKE